MPVLAVCSGKGGVGKTTVSANLAVSLSPFGKVLVIDGDIALPNLHTFFGLDDPFVSLLDVLKDITYLKDAIYGIKVKLKGSEDEDIVSELHVLPASTSVKALEEIDMERLKDVLESLKRDYDFIIVDVAAGLSKYAIIPMLSAEASYLVVNPEKASIIDSQKVKKIADVSGVKVEGIIVNRYRGEKKMVEYAENVVGAEVIGLIRESKLIRKCWEEGVPVTMRKPYAKVSRDFFDLARRLTGEKIEVKPYGKLKYHLG